MKTHFSLLAALLFCALPTLAAPANPAGTLVEAESLDTPGEQQKIEDATASGGAAVGSAKPWEPLLQAEVPATGDAFTIWLRHKYGPFVLKSVNGTTQTDLKYVKDNPAQWTWTNAGRYTRAQLGQQILVIRGPQSETPTILDALIFGDNDQPPTQAPAPQTPPKTDAPQIAVPPAKRPAGVLVEAEWPRPPGNNAIVDAPAASGGAAMTSTKAWEPILQAPVPPQGEKFTVWVRFKGGPLHLKTVTGEAQKDLHYVPAAPADWMWANAGRYPRAQLGDKILIIRGGDDVAAPVVDALVFATGEGGADETAMPLGKIARLLPPDQPDDDHAAPQTVNVSVNWSKKAGILPAALWGVNDYEILDPKDAAEANFQSLAATVKWPLVRVHQAQFCDKWTDAATRSWDVAKIRAGLDASTGYGGARLMMNIASWPRWMHEGEVLPEAKENEFAALCGELVRVFKAQQRPVAYWEFPNEKELAYNRAGQLPALWRLWNKIAVEIKKADPKAKVGGLAFAWARPQWVESFLKTCGAQVDFLAWHSYASNDIYESNESLFLKPAQMAARAREIRVLAQKLCPKRHLEFFLTEYNVQADWQPFERRHANALGAVFQASVVHQMALAGLDGVLVWHLKGDAYGLMDSQNQPRPPFELYRWGNRFLTGQMATPATPRDSPLEILAVQRKDGQRAILLLNTSPHRLLVPQAQNLLAAPHRVRQIQTLDNSGAKTSNLSSAPLLLRGYSLALLTE